MQYTAHIPNDKLTPDEERIERELVREVEALARAILAERLLSHPRYSG